MQMVRGHHYLMTLEALVIHQKIYKKNIFVFEKKKFCFPQLVKISAVSRSRDVPPFLNYCLHLICASCVGNDPFLFIPRVNPGGGNSFFLSLWVRDLGIDSTTSETLVSFRYHSFG